MVGNALTYRSNILSHFYLSDSRRAASLLAKNFYTRFARKIDFVQPYIVVVKMLRYLVLYSPLFLSRNVSCVVVVAGAFACFIKINPRSL